MNLGIEYRLGDVSLRAGYRGETGDNFALKSQSGGEQALYGLTGGLGFQKGSWKLDYAVAQSAAEYKPGFFVTG